VAHLNKTLVVFLIGLVSILSACTHSQLSYQLDPELVNFPPKVTNMNMVAFTLVDKTSNEQTKNPEKSISVVSKQQLPQLEQKFINKLKGLNYKIISNPLLADLAIKIEINQLDLRLEKGTFKSKFNAYSQIKLTINKKSESWSKIFRASKMQEVANPATDVDATGIINQLLSGQFEKSFSDPSLTKFLEKHQ